MIRINLNVMLAKRRMTLTQLSKEVGLTYVNLSVLKNERVKAIRLDTLNKICKAMDCQPGDILEYVPDENRREQNEN
jgi:putative transcriptional regulator